jgi:hypothetical protein
MAHFAEIDSNNVVLRVLVIADEHEHRGQEFLAVDCNLGGTWIQTSYNANIRGKFAAVGDGYDEATDEFYAIPSFDLFFVESEVVETPAIEN